MNHIGRSFMILALLLLAMVALMTTPQGKQMAASVLQAIEK